MHTEGSAQAKLRLGSEFSELSLELSQCEMPQYVSPNGPDHFYTNYH